MRFLVAFVRFWYDFIVGDDWLIAVGVIAAIALTALVADQGVEAWWLMPLAVVALLAGSVWRASRTATEEARDVGP
jgi:hypothetical protein